MKPQAIAMSAAGEPSIEAVRPRTITNPLIGDVVTFLKTTEETAGEYVLLELDLGPFGGRDNPLHIHLGQEETFVVKRGVVNITVAGETVTLREGQRATAPAQTPHRYFSESADRVLMQVEMRPAGKFEDGLRVIYGLARHERTDAHGVPRNLFDMALVAEMSDFYLASLPLWFQRLTFGALAKIGRLMGRDRVLVTYVFES